MIAFVKIAALLAIIYLSFTIVYPIVRPLSERRKKKARDFLTHAKKQAQKERLYYFKDVILHKFTSRILLGELKREEFKTLIRRLDLKTSPEELRAQQILLSIGAGVLAIIIIKISTLVGYLSLIGIVLGWMYPIDELERKVEKKNKNIMLDFPAFYSLLYYQYAKSVNIYLADVVRDFIPNANTDMEDELGVFMDNIEYGEEFALKQLKKRVPLRYIIKFCDIMQTRLNGYDNTSQMAYLKNELNDLRILALEDELKSRQAKNTRTQFSLIIVLAIFVIIYFYFQFMDAFNMFGFF